VRARHATTKLCRDCRRAQETDEHVANLRRYVDDARGWSNASDSRTMYFSELRGVVGALDALTKERDELRAAALAYIAVVDPYIALDATDDARDRLLALAGGGR